MTTEIRPIEKFDWPAIKELTRQFDHLMFYQRDVDLLYHYSPDIVVADSEAFGVLGYYHFIRVSDVEQIFLNQMEQLRCLKQLPDYLLKEAILKRGKLIVCMQGCSHRETFSLFIKHFQTLVPEIWCYCSKASNRAAGYEELGFSFDPNEERYFWNIHKSGPSTYRLGRWNIPSGN